VAPREYRLGRRGEAVEETRRRLTQATFELHNERGVARTSMKDIAERADVGVGTVYHHFPTYNDAITACGHLTMSVYPPPSLETLDGHRGWSRVEALVTTLMGYWAQCPFLAEVRCERSRYPALDAAAVGLDAWQAAFVHRALEPLGVAPEHEAVALALTDYGVWQALDRSGLAVAAASTSITDAVTTWLRSIKRKER